MNSDSGWYSWYRKPEEDRIATAAARRAEVSRNSILQDAEYYNDLRKSVLPTGEYDLLRKSVPMNLPGSRVYPTGLVGQPIHPPITKSRGFVNAHAHARQPFPPLHDSGLRRQQKPPVAPPLTKSMRGVHDHGMGRQRQQPIVPPLTKLGGEEGNKPKASGENMAEIQSILDESFREWQVPKAPSAPPPIVTPVITTMRANAPLLRALPPPPMLRMIAAQQAVRRQPVVPAALIPPQGMPAAAAVRPMPTPIAIKPTPEAAPAEAIPTKRKRGRPKGSTKASSMVGKRKRPTKQKCDADEPIPLPEPKPGEKKITQRSYYERGGFGDKTIWTVMYDQLVLYKKKHGKLDGIPGESELGKWCKRQRAYYCNETLSTEKTLLLERLGYPLKKGGYTGGTPWIDMYRKLEAFKAKHNHCRVPKNYEEDPKLSRWVESQRNNCKGNARRTLLHCIGFEWNVVTKWKTHCDSSREKGQTMTMTEYNWHKMYKRLVAFQKEFRSTLVPKRYKEDKELGQWVRHQRKTCEDPDRKKLLNGIGFVWDVEKFQLEAATVRAMCYITKPDSDSDDD